MKSIVLLPKTVMNLIALFTGEHNVLIALKNEIDYDMLIHGIHPEKTLLYGPVQSGKTEAIVRTIQSPQYSGLNKVLVIQNSLAVLKQYQQRLTSYGLSYHVVGPKSHKLVSLPPNEILLLINNRFRYNYYLLMPCKPTKYIALMDESDMYRTGSHPVAENARAQIYVTATPFHKAYKQDGFFNRVSKIKPAENYTGLKDVVLSYKDLPEAVEEFMGVSTGMMLINSVSRVAYMANLAFELSSMYPDTPILVLNDKKWVYHQNSRTRLKETEISVLIDRFMGHSHIIFIANRLSLRGLSYASSDYTRHLTHQYSNFNNIPITNCLQKMRLLGKRGPNHVACTLYLKDVYGIRKKMTKVLASVESATDKLPLDDANRFKIRHELFQMV